LESFEDGYLKDLRRRAADHALQIHLGTWSICPTSKAFKNKWGTAEEHLALGLRMAKAVGSPVLRVVLGSAGHPSAAIVRQDGRVQMIGGGGLPLGLFPDSEPGLSEATMSEGDLLFLYTNGLTQARGLDRTYFQPRLADVLAGLAGARPDQLATAMSRTLLEFTAGHLADDITMLIMRVGPHPGRAPRKR